MFPWEVFLEVVGVCREIADVVRDGDEPRCREEGDGFGMGIRNELQSERVRRRAESGPYGVEIDTTWGRLRRPVALALGLPPVPFGGGRTCLAAHVEPASGCDEFGNVVWVERCGFAEIEKKCVDPVWSAAMGSCGGFE